MAAVVANRTYNMSDKKICGVKLKNKNPIYDTQRHIQKPHLKMEITNWRHVGFSLRN